MKKKTKEIPFVECEFKYGSMPITKVISENGIDTKVVAFGDLRELKPTLINDKVEFVDNNGSIVSFDDSNLVYSTDYKGNYKHGLSPVPNNVPSKFNKIGAIRNGYDTRMQGVDTIFSLLDAFSSYGFNLSHAISYAVVSYKMAYLSYYYPVEYYCAVLRNYKSGTDGKLLNAINVAKRRGIMVAPPHINRSLTQYSVYRDENNNALGIIAGLGDIKGISGITSVIIEERERNGHFKSFEDFIVRCNCSRKKTANDKKYEKEMKLAGTPIVSGPNKTGVNSLILGGAFDCFEPNRYKLFKHYNTNINPVASIDKLTGKRIEGTNLFQFTRDDVFKILMRELKDESYTRLSKIELEEKYLLVPLSEHPLSNVNPEYLIDFNDYLDEDKIAFVGFIRGSKTVAHKDKKTGKPNENDRYGVFDVELANSTRLTARMWHITAPRVAKSIPRGLFSNKGIFDDREKSYLESKSELDSLTEKIKSGEEEITPTDVSSYNELFQRCTTMEILTQGSDYSPYIFTGTVSVWNDMKTVTLNSIKPYTGGLDEAVSINNADNGNTNSNAIINNSSNIVNLDIFDI